MDYSKVVFELAAKLPEQLPKSTLPEICFSGRSNVGKSSLINKILNRKGLARVSTKPGKTNTINFYRLGLLRLADLPGYGFAKVSKSEKQAWANLLEHYFTSGRNIKLVIQLIDMRHPPTGQDLDMLKFLKQSGLNFIVALTKSDKLNKTQREQRLLALKQEIGFLDNIPIIPFSAVTGEGVLEIRKLIESIE
ncbi:MAG TPA: YihA family ribosome biogenesis GTP-binding protein [Clostridiales bacterium]|nr:YihA family ribosome biogenesis GTP-binding protein [Clostridiales bacterium]